MPVESSGNKRDKVELVQSMELYVSLEFLDKKQSIGLLSVVQWLE